MPARFATALMRRPAGPTSTTIASAASRMASRAASGESWFFLAIYRVLLRMSLMGLRLVNLQLDVLTP